MPGMVGGERRAIQPHQGIGRTQRVEAVSGAVKRRVAQGAEARVERVPQGFFQHCKLAGLFAHDGVRRKVRGSEDLAKNIRERGDVRSEAGGLHEQGVIAGARGHGSSERFEGHGDFPGTAGGGALGQGGCEQLVEAVGCRCFGWQAGAHRGLQVHERNPVVGNEREC